MINTLNKQKALFYSFIFVLIGALLLWGLYQITLASPDKGPKARFVTELPERAAQGIAMGCKKVKESGKALTVLSCDPNIGTQLGLQEDIRVFAQDSTANAQIGANAVQTNGNTGSGRKVVVLDTGYNYGHPELSSSYLGGKDFVNNDDDPADDNGHGSHVAGIITADGVNATAKGIAPDAGVIAGKVLDAAGSGYFSDVEEAIYWAVDVATKGADGLAGTSDDVVVDAISLSLGTGKPYVYKGTCDNVLPTLTTAIKYAVDHGVLVVVAAGNSGRAGVSIPGCISYSTTVGAVNDFDKVASFSGRGSAVDISAPGVTIYSSTLGSSYASWSGTSMATPMVSATAALVKFAHPEYTVSQLESALFSTAKDLGKLGKDIDYGWGRVGANLAVQ